MKRIIWAGLIMLLCLFGTQAALADQLWQFGCTAEIYEQADLNSPMLATAQPGQIYIITEASVEDSWYRVQYQDMKTQQQVAGWLKNDRLAVASVLTNPPDHYHPGGDKWQLQASAEIYETADVNTPVLCEAQPGQVYTVMDSVEGTRWIQVAYTDMQSGDAVLGWLNEELLQYGSLSHYENAVPGDSAGFVSEGRTIGFVLCESLTVRAEPSGAAGAVASFKYAETFDILKENGDWIQANCDGTVGWVNGQYVLKNPDYYYVGAETAAYAYPAPDAKRVGLIAAGTTLPVILETENCYIVSLRSASAFILK